MKEIGSWVETCAAFVRLWGCVPHYIGTLPSLKRLTVLNKRRTNICKIMSSYAP